MILRLAAALAKEIVTKERSLRMIRQAAAHPNREMGILIALADGEAELCGLLRAMELVCATAKYGQGDAHSYADQMLRNGNGAGNAEQ